MWSSWVARWGYHYRKKKNKEPYLTPRRRLFSLFLALWSLLLTSSVRVATLAMQPRLVELWQYRVQHLRQYYVRKHRQRGAPTNSCGVWYLPVLLPVWLIVMSFIVLSGLKHHDIYKMDEDMAETYFGEVMCLTFLLVLFLWSFADDQSEKLSKSRHYNSKHCYGNCVMCSHHLLRNGTVQTCKNGGEVPVTMVVLPLRQRCTHKRVIKFIIPTINGPPRVIHQLLMLAGDVETNPGPETLTIKDLNKVMTSICDAKMKWDFIGLALGIQSPDIDAIEEQHGSVDRRLKEMLKLWLKMLKPSWEDLVEALRSKTVSEFQIAESIAKKHCFEAAATENSKDVSTCSETYTSSELADTEAVHSSLQSGCASNKLELLPSKYCKKWPCSESLQEQYEVQLQMETEEIKAHFVSFFDSFITSFLEREKSNDVCYQRLSAVVQNLFEFKKNYMESFQCSAEKLLSEVFSLQSYANFDSLKSIISSFGTPEDKKNAELYTDAFKAYAERRIFECNSEVLGKELPGHETMMFILDENQDFKIKDAHRFRLKLCKLLDIKQHLVLLHRVGSGSVLVFIQVPLKYMKMFNTLPLFYKRLLSLQEMRVRSYELNNDMVHPGRWNTLSSLCMECQDDVYRVGKTEFYPVKVDGAECLALKYMDCFTDESVAEVEYVQYLNCFFGNYKNLPSAKGVFYFESEDGKYSYPAIIVGKISSLREISKMQDIKTVNQISFLYDICRSVASFEDNRSYQISVSLDSMFIQENYGPDLEISACFCPLYGQSFQIKEHAQQTSSNLSPLPLQNLEWMNDLIKFIHFKSNVTAGSELPGDHILKKMFDQKWMSKEDCFRPVNFKVLTEELQHLLETEKTWLGLTIGLSGDLIDDEGQIHFILIGHTGVGKTSLRKHLKNEPININESPTIVMEPEYLCRESAEVMSNFPFQSINEALNKSGSKIYITMWDTGGQPVFQDLLPCFARLKCMYGIVFRLPDLKNFDARPEIRPCKKYFKSTVSPFTNKELIHRDLAYVEAFSCPLRDKLQSVQIMPDKEDNTSECYPAAVVIGTCRDVSESVIERDQIEQKKEELNEGISHLVSKRNVSVRSIPSKSISSKKSFIHEVDNTSSGSVDKIDQGISYLRDNITHCARQSSTKIPKSWKLFEVKLQRLSYTSHINIGIIPLSDAIAIGKECYVESPEAALKYFHELGTFMWYHLSERGSMRNYVVIDPKSLLEVLAKLFCYNPASIPQSQKQLMEIGIISINFFRTVLKQKASNFDDSWFMDFLEEHHLSMKVNYEKDIFFFLPSLLPIIPNYDINLKHLTSKEIDPLFIVPESGYIATGIFTRLLTALAGVTYGSTAWRIPLRDSYIKRACSNKTFCRNQFEFVVNESVHIVLSEFSTYIQVDCICKDDASVEDLYSYILSTLDVQLQRIVPRWLNKRGFNFTFPCSCSTKHHFLDIELESRDREVKCSEGTITELSPTQSKWFGFNLDTSKNNDNLFRKSLEDGILDISIVTVIFCGLNDSDVVSAKHVTFQEPIAAKLLSLRQHNHDIYFRPQGNTELKKVQQDVYNDVIFHSLLLEQQSPMDTTATQSTPLESLDDSLLSGRNSDAITPQIELQTSYFPARKKSRLAEHADTSKITSVNEAQEQGLSDAMENKELIELSSTDAKMEYSTQPQSSIEKQESAKANKFLKQIFTDAADYFVKHLVEYKNNGKIEFFHVFNFGSYAHLKEFVKLFIKKVTMSVLLTNTSEKLDQKELDMIEYNSSFTLKGMIVGKNIGMLDRLALNHFSDFLIYDEKKPFFCMNYDSPEESDYKAGLDIIEHALQLSQYDRFPFSWYLFGFNLLKYMKSHNVNAVSVSSDCMIIAKEFGMDRPTVETALEHLTENNIVLYFRDILNDKVFVGAEIFFPIFSALFLKHCESELLLPVISNFHINMIFMRCAGGFISLNDLTSLFTKLMIIAPFDSSHYMIPSFLSLLNAPEREKVCAEYMDSESVPLYIECPSSGYEFVSMLTVFLLSIQNTQWEIYRNSSGQPVCMYKNCKTFFHKKTNLIITVSYVEKYIEVLVKSQSLSQVNLGLISSQILQGLEKIRILLNLHVSYDFALSFQCNCGHQVIHTAKCENEEGEYKVLCSVQKNTLPLNKFQKRWLNSDSGTIRRYLSVNTVVEYLDSSADKWIQIAKKLQVPNGVIESVLVSRLKDDRASLRKVIEWWFKNEANPEWSTIENIVENTAFVEAIKEDSIDEKHVQAIFIGPNGSGKTSLLHRLIHTRPNFLYTSTGVADPVITADVSVFYTASVPHTWQQVKFDQSLHSQIQEKYSSQLQQAHTKMPPVSKKFHLYLRDAGGLVEFQEAVPLLVSGPSLFLFVFRADQDMKSTFQVGYRTSASEFINYYTSSITTEEALLQFLASVYAMETSGKASSHNHHSYVLIVATHKDRLGPYADQKISELNTNLKSLIKESGCESLVLYADIAKGQVMFTVDNTSESDNDFELIRSKINHLIVSRQEFTIKFPISYLQFCLELQNDQRSILTLEECRTMAAKHRIDGYQVLDLLYTLHDRLGVIFFFNVKGVRPIIMKRPEDLFSKVTDLIVRTFSWEALSMREIYDFQRKGILTASAFASVISHKDAITAAEFIKILAHLRIIAEFPKAGDEEKRYFIPCVLNHVSESTGENLKTSIAPMTVKFQCRHCPRGLFGVLVTHLMTPEPSERIGSSISFTLRDDSIFKDKVSFIVESVSRQDAISLKFHPLHIEINFYPQMSEDHDTSVASVCCEVRKRIFRSIIISLTDLRYNIFNVEPVMCIKCVNCTQLHEVNEGKKHTTIYCPNVCMTLRIPRQAQHWWNSGESRLIYQGIQHEPQQLTRLSQRAPPTLVQDCHYNFLMEQLVPCQAKWERIAAGLHFHPYEIESIKASPVTMWGGPEACLGKVLSQWLNWAEGDARGSQGVATLEALQTALDRAGFPKLATSLTLTSKQSK